MVEGKELAVETWTERYERLKAAGWAPMAALRATAPLREWERAKKKAAEAARAEAPRKAA